MTRLNLEDRIKLGLSAACAVIAAGSILALAYLGVDRAQSQVTALAPFQTNATIGTGATLSVLPVNPTRRGLIICNGHASQSITVGFGSNTPVSLTSGLVIPGGNTAASCFNFIPNNLTSPLVSIGAQVNIIASGASTPVTLLEF